MFVEFVRMTFVRHTEMSALTPEKKSLQELSFDINLIRNVELFQQSNFSIFLQCFLQVKLHNFGTLILKSDFKTNKLLKKFWVLRDDDFVRYT